MKKIVKRFLLHPETEVNDKKIEIESLKNGKTGVVRRKMAVFTK